jgi:hypothetical protein
MWYAFFQKERQPLTIHRHNWGVTGIGLDANDASKVCLSAGMYTNSWDANNGSILRSSDSGTTWSETKLPFKLPGNQPAVELGNDLSSTQQIAISSILRHQVAMAFTKALIKE